MVKICPEAPLSVTVPTKVKIGTFVVCFLNCTVFAPPTASTVKLLKLMEFVEEIVAVVVVVSLIVPEL